MTQLMQRLIDKSFSLGPGRLNCYVMLNDAIAVVEEEKAKRIAAEKRVAELEAEIMVLRDRHDTLSEHLLHIVPRFKKMREHIREHMPHFSFHHEDTHQ